MGFVTAFLEVNFISVLVATLLAVGFGALWYGVLFGEAWMRAVGKSKDDLKRSALSMVVAVVGQFVMATMLYGVMQHIGADGIRAGIISALLLWFGFVLPTMAINNSFQGARPILTVINSGYFLCVLIIMGTVLGWFGV